jgi:tetratricopeptide (TPR) repeat protein
VTASWLILTTAFFPLAPLPAATSLGQSAGLSAAAAASGRPPECMAGSRRALSRGPSVWEEARVPNLRRYCDLMARAQTKLATQPDAAKAAAIEADTALPGRPSPAVVLARAWLLLGAVEEAARAFEKARALDPRSVEDPGTMHDLARVLAKTGKRDEALAVYRALVPRVDLLGTTERRVSVLLEAAHVSMAAEGAGTATLPAEVGSKTPRSRLDEAVAYLREARQRPPTQLAGDVLLSLSLVLDRKGDREQAEAAIAEAQRTGAKTRAGTLEYIAAPDDAAALAALAAEGTDRAAAQKGWEGYLAGAGGKGPWAAAARARLELLKKGIGARPASVAPGKGEVASPKVRGSK